MLIISTSTKVPEVILEQVSCIQYLVKFPQDKKTAQVLINFGNIVNAMTQAYVAMLDFKICFTAIKAHKIDSSFFKIFDMTITNFQVRDKVDKDWFF